ncbi:MAG: threonine/serine dehydratase [Bacteroidota bacterium]
MNPFPSAKELRAAALRCAPLIHLTPVLTSATLDAMTGASLFFKCENFQKIGAFKIRGATNFMHSLPREQMKKGVVTHSSGNHAQAVAKTARDLGVPAYIVMPETAPAVKVAAVRGYGAEVIVCTPTLEARETTAQSVIDRTGATFVHPYDDDRVILGQSTCAQELLEDYGPFDIVMAPVGGGGLLGGTALAVHHFAPGTQVIAAEPAAADDAYRSFKARQHFPSENPQTIGDGLLTSVGKRNFEMLLELVDDVVTCSEAGIVRAMRLIWERMKIIIEPSCAVPLACILEGKVAVKGKKIGIILTGGNVDLDRFFSQFSPNEGQ